ncbi:MAG: hypothetical protein LBQ59_02050 [Candidatus Peribacteria bacterium]|jgi:hypothetical protein|nr:hypothetical protein [Candidatus Peribacteria bacterium]
MTKLNKTFSFKTKDDLWTDSYYERFLSDESTNSVKNLMSTNIYRNFFEEDIVLYVFPQQINSQDWQLSLQSEDDVIKKLFCKNNSYYCDDYMAEFFRNKLKELLYESKIGLEIYTDEKEENHLIQFQARSLRFSLLRGKYYQKFPKNRDKYKNSLSYSHFPESGRKTIYFDKDDFFILYAPKIFLKTFPKLIKHSNMLILKDKAQIFTDCQEQNITFKCIEEKKLFQYRMFTNVGCGRMDGGNDITEYYYLYRSLKLAHFMAKVREEFIEQMNLLLKTVCKKLNRPPNKFIISGLASSTEYEDIEEKMRTNKISFEEVFNKINGN